MAIKGKRKRLRTAFKHGHTRHSPCHTRHSPRHCNQESQLKLYHWTRLDHDVYQQVVRQTATGALVVPDSEGISGAAKLLRPRQAKAKLADKYLKNIKEQDKKYGGMIIVDKEKMFHMFNQCQSKHSAEGRCKIPEFQISKEIKKGICWKYILNCKNCLFVSETFNMYRDVPNCQRGAKTAAPNMALQVGLQDSPIGNSQMRHILATTDIDPPSRSAMQQTSNQVGSKTIILNDDDMSKRIEGLKNVNELRGLSRDTPIAVQMDARYNSTSIGSRKSLGQAASQAVGICCEDHTDEHQIIGMVVQNKLCWTGAWLKAKGYNVDCPGKHANCTANIKPHEPLSEYTIGKELGLKFGLHQLLIKYATTDGDGRSAAGMEEGLKFLHPLWNVIRLADPIHLGQSQFRKALSANFSEGMFPGDTKAEKAVAQKVFAMDVKTRCQQILACLLTKYGPNAKLIGDRLPKIIDATVLCYQGDCSKCRYNSIVCDGGKRKNWIKRSVHLSPYGLTKVNMNPNDEVLLMDILAMKLSKESLEKLKFGTNTQRCEAINRGISSSLPKNVNYSRNATSRVASAIHRLNNGVAESTHKKLEALGCPLTRGGRAAQSLKAMEKNKKYDKLYKKTHKFKQSQFKRRISKAKNYYGQKKEISQRKHLYKRGQLDVPVNKCTVRTLDGDHTYARKISN